MAVINQLKKLSSLVGKILLQLLTWLSLSLTYFLGIGLTVLVGKLVGKKFLSTTQAGTQGSSLQGSSLQTANYETDLKKMF